MSSPSRERHELIMWTYLSNISTGFGGNPSCCPQANRCLQWWKQYAVPRHSGENTRQQHWGNCTKPPISLSICHYECECNIERDIWFFIEGQRNASLPEPLFIAFKSRCKKSQEWNLLCLSLLCHSLCLPPHGPFPLRTVGSWMTPPKFTIFSMMKMTISL